MSEHQEPTGGRPKLPALARRGAWIGAASGGVLSLILRVVLGPPAYFLPKALAIVVIVALLGAFVGTLVAKK